MPGINTTSYEDLFQTHLLDKAENRELTLIKMMLEKEVESLTKMVTDRNASINRLSEIISRMVVDAQEKKQELQEKERVLLERYDIIAKQVDKIVVLRDAIHCMQGEAKEKDVAMGEHYDTIMRQADKLLKLQQHINKMKELCTYGDYEETNEWVGGCEKRTCYDDSQGQTPPGYGSTQPTRKTSGSPKQSYDYRKVGI